MTHFYKGFQVRSWQPSDRQAVISLARDVLAEYRMCFEPDGADQDIVQIEIAYWQTGGEFWVVEHQGLIVGSGGYHPCNRAALPQRPVELRKFFLRPQARGKGLGKYLLAELETAAMAKGFTQMWLETATCMHAAIALYERYGYLRLDHSDAHVERCDRVYLKHLGINGTGDTLENCNP